MRPITFLCAALLASSTAAYPQGDTDAVTVTALRDPVDKSYRRIVAGMEVFEKRRHLAPAAPLRFKLLPRNRETELARAQGAAANLERGEVYAHGLTSALRAYGPL